MKCNMKSGWEIEWGSRVYGLRFRDLRVKAESVDEMVRVRLLSKMYKQHFRSFNVLWKPQKTFPRMTAQRRGGVIVKLFQFGPCYKILKKQESKISKILKALEGPNKSIRRSSKSLDVKIMFLFLKSF